MVIGTFAMRRPFDPRSYPRSNLMLAGGRLRALPDMILRRELVRLAGRRVARRPLGWRDEWSSGAQTSIWRNGHQARRRAEILAAMLVRLRRQLVIRPGSKQGWALPRPAKGPRTL